jgi:hypothetical protein
MLEGLTNCHSDVTLMQDVVPVGDGSQDMIQDEPGGSLEVLLVAGRTEPVALAGEGQKVLVVAIVAANAGEAAGQVAAVQEFVDHLGDDGTEQAIAGLVLLGVDLHGAVRDYLLEPYHTWRRITAIGIWWR